MSYNQNMSISVRYVHQYVGHSQCKGGWVGGCGRWAWFVTFGMHGYSDGYSYVHRKAVYTMVISVGH